MPVIIRRIECFRLGVGKHSAITGLQSTGRFAGMVEPSSGLSGWIMKHACPTWGTRPYAIMLLGHGPCLLQSWAPCGRVIEAVASRAMLSMPYGFALSSQFVIAVCHRSIFILAEPFVASHAVALETQGTI